MTSVYRALGDADVEQAAFLVDRLRGVGVDARHHALVDADAEHGVPLQPLGRVQRGQGDAVGGGRVGVLGPAVEVGHQGGEVGGVAELVSEVGGHRHDGVQRLPAVADGAGAARRGVGVPHARQHGTHLVDERTGVVLSAPCRAAQQRDRLPDLGPLEEALDAAQRERDAVLAERLLVHLGLRVDAEQHGHLAVGVPRRCSVAISSATALASAVSSGCPR